MEYTLEPFGQFNNCDIQAICDIHGNYWFTQEVIASALGMDRTNLAHIRSNHSSEFHEGEEYTTIVFAGKRRVVFSEEGFMTVCDMASTEVAYRLRRWMRQQFKVKQQGNQITVQPKNNREDLSDLGTDLQLLQKMVDSIADNRRRLLRLAVAQEALEEEQRDLRERVTATESRVQAIEKLAKIHPGEMTAIQLAVHCRWMSDSGAPHNVAIVLAAVNDKFDEKGWMIARTEEGPNGQPVEVQVFTVAGVASFLHQIDAKYLSGQRFTIQPNGNAMAKGYKNSRYVTKR